MNSIAKIIVCFFSITLLFSCRREGLGGDNTLVVSVAHATTAVKGATFYVRYGAKDFPGAGPSDYDLARTALAVNDSVHIVGLRKGDYFIYSIGYDSLALTTVSGGKHIFISTKSGNTALKLALTE